MTDFSSVDTDGSRGIPQHVINGTEVLIINGSNINSHAKIQILNIYGIIIGVTERRSMGRKTTALL